MNCCLRWFRFLLAVHVWYKRHMDQGEVVVTDTELELSHGFYEWRGLYVTDSASKLNRYTLVERRR